ncbi:hypothetical protein E4K10_22630 [Streptomyces sp. T1317-0309]|nr:hypothetical protein E4K10_22630 [Streptomyces sp. T1317-0309]
MAGDGPGGGRLRRWWPGLTVDGRTAVDDGPGGVRGVRRWTTRRRMTTGAAVDDGWDGGPH